MTQERLAIECLAESLRNDFYNHPVIDDKLEHHIYLEAYKQAIYGALSAGEITPQSYIKFFTEEVPVQTAIEYIKANYKPLRIKGARGTWKYL